VGQNVVDECTSMLRSQGKGTGRLTLVELVRCRESDRRTSSDCR